MPGTLLDACPHIAYIPHHGPGSEGLHLKRLTSARELESSAPESGGAGILTQSRVLPKPKLFPLLSLSNYPFEGSANIFRMP